MPLYELATDRLTAVDTQTFTQLGRTERGDRQRAIRMSIEAITPDADVKTMVLAEEFGDWVGANRRIDPLCLDADANLVVVELKRESATHMELQALRYAAMVSTMRLEQAVQAHAKYLRSIGSQADAEQSIRDFLGVSEGPVAFTEKVRIVLAASEFNTEITTTVLWLNQQGLDIRCVQLRPHQVEDRLLVDIKQIIPLPEAASYTVALREKSNDQAVVQVDKERYKDLVITRLSTGAIHLERNGVSIQPVLPELRRLAEELGVSVVRPSGGAHSAPSLGRLLIKKISSG